MPVTATRNGQVTIPKPVRDRFGIKALFLAGKAFERYRAQGGSRTEYCPIFSSAPALPSPRPLLTRDPRPYRTYFAGINLIASNEIEPR